MKTVIKFSVILLMSFSFGQAQAVRLEGPAAVAYMNQTHQLINGLADLAQAMCRAGTIIQSEFTSEIAPRYSRLFNNYEQVYQGSFENYDRVYSSQQSSIAADVAALRDKLLEKNFDHISQFNGGSYCDTLFRL